MVLSKEDLFKFIETAPSDNLKFLVRKAVAIIGYFGGLRCAELANLNFSDIEIKSESISVFIRSSKTDPHGKSNFYFTIPKVSESVDTCPFNLIKMYVNAVSDKSGRFFNNFNVKSKSFSCQPMGRNTIAGIPKFMANFLDLETPEQYTGHCFRRSAATALADSGGLYDDDETAVQMEEQCSGRRIRRSEQKPQAGGSKITVSVEGRPKRCLEFEYQKRRRERTHHFELRKCCYQFLSRGPIFYHYHLFLAVVQRMQ